MNRCPAAGNETSYLCRFETDVRVYSPQTFIQNAKIHTTGHFSINQAIELYCRTFLEKCKRVLTTNLTNRTNKNQEKLNQNLLSTCTGWGKSRRKSWVNKPRIILFVNFVLLTFDFFVWREACVEKRIGGLTHPGSPRLFFRVFRGSNSSRDWVAGHAR